MIFYGVLHTGIWRFEHNMLQVYLMQISLSKFDLTVDTRREGVKVQDNPARNYMLKVNKKKH